MQQFDPDLRALQEVRDYVERAARAHEVVHAWSQVQIDKLCAAMADAGEAAAHDLARIAVDETGIGRVHYKVLKNLLGSRGIWNSSHTACQVVTPRSALAICDRSSGDRWGRLPLSTSSEIVVSMACRQVNDGSTEPVPSSASTMKRP